jgi:hypothetical protein
MVTNEIVSEILGFIELLYGEESLIEEIIFQIDFTSKALFMYLSFMIF